MSYPAHGGGVGGIHTANQYQVILQKKIKNKLDKSVFFLNYEAHLDIFGQQLLAKYRFAQMQNSPFSLNWTFSCFLN